MKKILQKIPVGAWAIIVIVLTVVIMSIMSNGAPSSKKDEWLYWIGFEAVEVKKLKIVWDGEMKRLDSDSK